MLRGNKKDSNKKIIEKNKRDQRDKNKKLIGCKKNNNRKLMILSSRLKLIKKIKELDIKEVNQVQEEENHKAAKEAVAIGEY